MPSIPDACGKSYVSQTPGTLQVRQPGASRCLPVSEKVKSFRLRFFGHLARSATEKDYHRVVAATHRPPTDCRTPKTPVGRPRTTWPRTVDEDVQPQNFLVQTTCRKASDKGYLAPSRQHSNVLLAVRH